MTLALIQQIEVAKKLICQFKIAESSVEIHQCQSLISEIYYKKMGITFSESEYDIEAKIELYPHHYLMGLVNDELIACMGLYLHSTNPERYGKVTEEEINKLLIEAGAANRYSGKHIRELTKFVVKDEWRNRRIGKLLMGVAHSKDFIHMNEEQPHLLVYSAKVSVFKHFIEALNIRTRIIKPVPFYKIHESYRSHSKPMESRLIIPDIDIPAQWYHHSPIPGDYEIEI